MINKTRIIFSLHHEEQTKHFKVHTVIILQYKESFDGCLISLVASHYVQVTHFILYYV